MKTAALSVGPTRQPPPAQSLIRKRPQAHFVLDGVPDDTDSNQYNRKK